MRVKYRLRIERGSGPRAELVVDDDGITIGRGPAAGFVVHDLAVSPLHCELRRSGDGFTLRDLDSQSGTRVGGIPVREALLVDGTRFVLGATELSFATVEARPVPSKPPGGRRRYTRPGRRAEVTALPFKRAKSQIVERFEREYVAAMLEQCGGNITAAAQTAELHRVHFLRLMDRYGMRRTKMKNA